MDFGDRKLQLPKITQPSALDQNEGLSLISKGKHKPTPLHPIPTPLFCFPTLLSHHCRADKLTPEKESQMPRWLLHEYINVADILQAHIPLFTLGYITPLALSLYKHATLNANSDATLDFFFFFFHPSFCFWISNIQHDTGLLFGFDSRYSKFLLQYLCEREGRGCYRENKFVLKHSQIWFACLLFCLN